MKTKELIEELQKIDPSGELDVVGDGQPIYFVEKQSAYDYPIKKLFEKDNKVVGYKITKLGEKINIYLFDYELFAIEYGMIDVDLSELDAESREKYELIAEKAVKNYSSEEL